MAKEKLDVFISSDQKEFSKERIKLAGTICAIPFLTCILLENRGADPTGVLEASLKGVRDSDIYVGIFGHEHSEITVREYEQAVKMRKPCLTYVKKARRKDETLEKFINEELKGQFKYHEFRNVAGLIQQVESDLKRFILETLEVGLEARAQKKTEAVALIRKEQLVSLKETTSTSPLARADAAFKRGNYLESLINTTIALETELRKALKARKVNGEGRALGALLQMALNAKIINIVEANRLREISYLRNAAVHQGDTPNRDKTLWILENTRHVLKRLDSDS